MVRTRRMVIVLVLAGALAGLLLVALPSVSLALPAYSTATGQACGVCHVAPGGGGALTALGTRFAAIPTHTTNPAGAFTQASAPAAPTAAPAAPTAAPTAAAAPPTAVPTARPATTPAATASPAPVATATATTTALPKTGGFPLPLIPAAIVGLFALSVGVFLRRR